MKDHPIQSLYQTSTMGRKMPHICFIAPNAFPMLVKDEFVEFAGGAELQQILIARGLVTRGYRVSMICLDFGQEDEIEIDGIRILRAYRRTAGVPVLRFIWPRLTSIWACLNRADADIYYQRTAGMLTGVVAAYCQRTGKKSIFAAAGNPDLEPDTPRIQFWRDRRIYEFGLRHVDRILVQNNEQKRLCRKFLKRDPVHIPNLFPVPSTDVAGAGSYILWVSMIRGLKRPALFLDLAESLPQYQFRMIGGAARGEEPLFRSIEARAQSIANLEFLGFVPNHKIDKHFVGAAVLVNTSESEGFPNTFLHAWARGIPTVSFIDAGARLDGQLVGCTAKTLQEMIGVIIRLLADETNRQREAEKVRSYYAKNHAPERILDLYEKVINELFDSGD